jgi:tetratricopeptide (TPR) repeat protein
MFADLLSRHQRRSFVRHESSSFVGRRRELSALGRAVGEGRLVTLVGEPGVGKSRLALRFAHARRAAYEGAGGVWFCALGETADVEGMCAEVARALAIADEGAGTGEAAALAVGRALAARGRALLLLDHLQHLLPAAADAILGWLDLAPELRIVVTSREPLSIIGEEIVELGPLGLVAEDGESEAVALFLERVRARRGAYRPTAADARAIADTVERVRGVPLAIELCASQWTLPEIEPRPSRRSSKPAAPGPGPRAAAEPIAASFRRLDPAAREVLAQASIFRGGFTLAAAEAVVVLPRAHAFQPVRAVIRALLQEGLLQTTRVSPEPRFAMCEAIRPHAAESLALGDEAASAPFRHARFYLDLAAGPLTDLPATSRSAASREELAAERDNLEGVLAFAAARGLSELLVRAAVALDVIASGSGLTRAQLDLLDGALRRGGLEVGMVGRALGLRAGALRALGRMDEAERDAAAALALAEEAGNARQIVAMRLAVGGARFQAGDLAAALAHSRAALAEARAAADLAAEPLALQQIGAVLQAAGDDAQARAHYEGALSLAVELGDEVAECRASMGLGSYHLEAGDHERAEHAYDRALLIARRLRMVRNARIVLGYLGVLHLDAGRPQEAEQSLDHAARLSRAAGDVRVEGVFTGIRGAALASLDLVDEARGAFAVAEELLAPTPYFAAVIELHRGHLDLAEAREALEVGDRAGAADLTQAASLRLALAERDGAGVPALLRRSDDARIAARILRRAIGSRPRP